MKSCTEYQQSLPTPLGTLYIRATTDAIFSVSFDDNTSAQEGTSNHLTRACSIQLQEYFDSRRRFFDLPLAPHGSAYSRTVWQLLRAEILWGQQITYGELARRTGRPGSARATGRVVGANPIGIIIPCHRVVAAHGGLGGFGWGIERKVWLLNHEKKQGL